MKNTKNNQILNRGLLYIAGVFLVLGQLVLPVQAAGISASAVIAETNAVRSGKGLGTLSVNSKLMRSAQLKANDMAANGYFSHADAEGHHVAYWLSYVGYSYVTGGENLAEGFDSTESAMQAWINSPTHYANLVRPVYTEIGVGVAEGTYEGKPTVFVVQHFGTPKEVTPVATQVPAAPKAVAPAPVAQNTSKRVLVADAQPVPVVASIPAALAAEAGQSLPGFEVGDYPVNLDSAALYIADQDPYNRLADTVYFTLLLMIWLMGMVEINYPEEMQLLALNLREDILGIFKRKSALTA